MWVKSLLSFSFLLLVLSGLSKKLKKTDREILNNIQQYTTQLSVGLTDNADQEKVITDYINRNFERIGLTPLAEKGFGSDFTVNKGKLIKAGTYFRVNGHMLNLKDDFFPLAFSGDGNLEAVASIALPEVDMPWFMDIAPLLSKGKQLGSLEALINEKARDAKSKGATALIVYNSGEPQHELEFSQFSKESTSTIPVIFIRENAWNKHFNDVTSNYEISFNIKIEEELYRGSYSAGYINNSAPATIIFGVRCMAESTEKTSSSELINTNSKKIATLLELASKIKQSGYRNNNYLFLVFPAEDENYYASRAFIKTEKGTIGEVNYIVNLDGLNSGSISQAPLKLAAYKGLSSWAGLLSGIRDKDLYLNLDEDSSSVSSYFYADTPALCYFQPKDVSAGPQTVDYMSGITTIRHILKLLEITDRKDKLSFAKE
jgi:aminopeptidase YwaD